MKQDYIKTTNASRRLHAQIQSQKLMKELSETDPRKPGYVSKSPRNQIREASNTKGLDYSKCLPVGFKTVTPGSGEMGIVLMQNKARSDKPIIKVLAWKVQWAVPGKLRELMGLPALPEKESATA